MAIPLDYASYSAILERADIRQRLRKMASREAALASLVAEEPTSAHAAAYARLVGRRTPIAKAAPGTPPPAQPTQERPHPVQKEELAPVQKQEALHPKAEIDRRVAAVQQTTGLPYDKALSQVAKEDPALPLLWNTYIQAQRKGAGMPQVQKQEAPSYEQIVQIAKAQAASRPDLTTEQALADLALAHPGEAVYWEAHRRWHLSDAAMREHLARQLATRQGA